MDFSRHITTLIGTLLLAGILFVYIAPGIVELKLSSFASILNNEDGEGSALQHSLCFALCSTLLNILVGLWIAVNISESLKANKRDGWLVLLIIPALLGDTSITFIGKVLLSDATYVQQHTPMKFLAMLGLQFWQYGTLFTYLFWLGIRAIDAKYFRYATACGLSSAERLRDIVLPHLKNLLIIGAIINYCFAFVEQAKIQVIFFGSQGTHSEFITQWLVRTYETGTLLDPIQAGRDVIKLGWGVIIGGLLVMLCMIVIVAGTLNRFLKVRKSVAFLLLPVYLPIPHMLLLVILLPVIFLLLKFPPIISTDDSSLGFPLLLTFFTATIATLVTVLIATTMRLTWRNELNNFNRRSYAIIIGMLFTQLIPALIVAMLGYRWLTILKLSGLTWYYLVWVTIHVLLAVPVLLSFMIVSHFKLLNPVLDFLEVHQVGWTQKLGTAFLKPFAGDYLFTLLFAFALIWNEAAINSLLSDYVPSFVSQMKMSITGRALDYARGENYFIISLLVAVSACWTWLQVTIKNRTTHGIAQP